MAGAPKETLRVVASADETTDLDSSHGTETRELFLRDGKTLVVSDQGRDQLVEVRASSGQVEVRIRLTDQGPVLQMESVRLELKATEAIAIESRSVEIKGTDHVAVEGQDVSVHGDHDVKVDAAGEVRVVGKMIYLN